MKKKREARQEKKEQNDRETSMKPISTSSYSTFLQTKGVPGLTEREMMRQLDSQDQTYFNIGHETHYGMTTTIKQVVP